MIAALRRRVASIDPRTRKRVGWIAAALIVANEIRGLLMVAAIVKIML